MASNTPIRSAAVGRFLDSLPDEVRDRVELLRQVQSKCDVVKNDFLKESKALEEKYRKLFEPLFKERFDLVVGSEDKIPEGNQEPGMVPGFWLKVLKSADLVGGNVSKRDEPILMYLLDVSHMPLENSKPGFKLVFKVDAVGCCPEVSYFLFVSLLPIPTSNPQCWRRSTLWAVMMKQHWRRRKELPLPGRMTRILGTKL